MMMRPLNHVISIQLDKTQMVNDPVNSFDSGPELHFAGQSGCF
jgi:hypothetical protein